MFGAGGVVGAVGTAPRLGGTNAQSSDAPVLTHSHGVASDALSCAVVSAFAAPVAVSPTHNSIPLSRVFINAKRFPSGENAIHVSSAFAGTVTFFSVVSAVDLSVIARNSWVRCG